MPRRSRVELNRAKLEVVQQGLADGVFDLSRAILRVAESRAPYAELPQNRRYHLNEMGGAMVYVQGRRTHEASSNPHESSPKLIKGASVRKRGGIIGFVGFGFPAMFVEFGTVNMHAEPFLTPAAGEVVGSEARIILSAAMLRRFAGQRSPATARIAAAKAAAKG